MKSCNTSEKKRVSLLSVWLFAGALMEQTTNHGSQTYPIIYTMAF